MKLACEIPIKYLDVCNSTTDFDFVLAHLVIENVEYSKYYSQIKSNSTRKMILDNGVFELGKAIPYYDIIHAASIVNPDIIIAPDVLGDAAATKDEFIKFLAYSSELIIPRSDLGVVIQGKTLTEAIECYNYFSNIPEVKCICFPFGARYQEFSFFEKDVQCMCSRLALITQLTKQGNINLNKWHHLLGCNLPMELRLLSKYNWITSLDTSVPFLSVMRQTPLLENIQKFIRSNDYFLYNYSNQTADKFCESILELKSLINN